MKRAGASHRLSPHIQLGLAVCLSVGLCGSAQAQDIKCVMADGTPVAFQIDPNQFIDAVSSEEPIRRKVTQIRMGDSRFPAEPFIIGQMRGFHAEDLGGTSMMFVVRPDGSARAANARQGYDLSGTCEVAG